MINKTTRDKQVSKANMSKMLYGLLLMAAINSIQPAVGDVATESSAVAQTVTDDRKQTSDNVSSGQTGGNATLPKVTVEADAEYNPYDPTNTNDPYNKSYSVSNSSTTTKTDTPIMETPASIQVVSKSVLHDQQAFRLQDAIKNVSGVQTWHAYGGGAERFVMRGFLQSPVNFRNGIRIPVTHFDLANVERVEVLKGASAMLFGFADPGGIISATTKQPSSDPYYSLEQRFGSYDFYRTEANATGALSKDYGLDYRLDLSYLNSNSFRQLVSNDRIFFAPTLSWQLTSDTNLTLSFEHYDQDLMYDSGIPAQGMRLAKINRSTTFTQPGLGDTHSNNLIELRIDHRINDNIKMNAGTLAFQNIKDLREFYLDANLKEGEVAGQRWSWFGDERLDSLTSWLNFTFDFETYGVKHKVLLGGEYYTTYLHADAAAEFVDKVPNVFTFNPNLSNVPTAFYDNAARGFQWNLDNTSQSIYLQDQMTLWEKLHILGGFRYDWMERKQELAYYSPLEKDTRSDDFVSPRVGILYEPLDWLSVFGSFSESFGPAINYDGATQRIFDPESATQFEGGLKTTFFDGKFIANLAYFDLEKNTFVADPNNRAFVKPIQGQSNGVEFDMQGQLFEGVSVIGTYAYTDTKVSKDTVAENIGNRLPYVPTHQGSVWLKYDFNEGMFRGLSLGAGVYAAGRRYGDTANSYFDESYARLDLMAAYKKKLGDTTLTTQVNINNVNDAEYFNLRARWTNLPAEPLTVLGSLRLEY